MISFLFLNICFVLFSLSLQNHIKKSQRKYILIFLFVCFSFIVAFRPETTPDTEIYIRGFINSNTSWLNDFNIFKKYGNVFEYGYVCLMLGFKVFSQNYKSFFFVFSLLGIIITIACLYYFTNKIEADLVGDNEEYLKCNPLVLLSIYLCSYALLYNGISVRAGISMALGLLFVVFMLEKKYLFSVAFLLIAFSIHRISIFYVVIFLFIKFIPTINIKIHYYIWIISGLLLFTGAGLYLFKFIYPIISGFMLNKEISSSMYLTEARQYFSLSHTDILRWLIYGFLIIFNIKSEMYKKYLNLIACGTVILSIFNNVMAISRFYDLFLMFTVPMFYALLNHDLDIVNNNRLKNLIVYIILFMNFYILLRLCIINSL